MTTTSNEGALTERACDAGAGRAALRLQPSFKTIRSVSQ